jgi:hypothetical protein
MADRALRGRCRFDPAGSVSRRAGFDVERRSLAGQNPVARIGARVSMIPKRNRMTMAPM